MSVDVEIAKSVTTKHGVVELRSDNILYFKPDLSTFTNYTIPVLNDLLEVFVEITDGIPRPYLCDNRYIPAIVNKEELAHIDKHFCKFATHAAMLTHSGLIRVLLNRYNSIFKPNVELKLFKTEERAIKWLLTNDQSVDC